MNGAPPNAARLQTLLQGLTSLNNHHPAFPILWSPPLFLPFPPPRNHLPYLSLFPSLFLPINRTNAASNPPVTPTPSISSTTTEPGRDSDGTRNLLGEEGKEKENKKRLNEEDKRDNNSNVSATGKPSLEKM